jgi:hypothetical protein
MGPSHRSPAFDARPERASMKAVLAHRSCIPYLPDFKDEVVPSDRDLPVIEPAWMAGCN